MEIFQCLQDYWSNLFDPPFEKAKRSDYGEGHDCISQIQENEEKMCSKPTKKELFSKNVFAFLPRNFYLTIILSLLMVLKEGEPLWPKLEEKDFQKNEAKKLVFLKGKTMLYR